MHYWDRAFRDVRLDAAEARDYLLKGIAAADRALAIKADAVEVLTCKVLLLRHLAAAEPDPAGREALIAEADRLRGFAVDLQKKEIAGLS
jgi:hypothetical protein